MALHWGGWDGRFQVGIDINPSPDNADLRNGHTSQKLTIKFYVRTDLNSVNDTQSLTIRGPGFTDTTITFDMTTANSAARLVATREITVGLSYSSTKTSTFSSSLSGVYNGATPSATYSFTTAKRPIAVPDRVSTPSVSSITSTGAKIDWSAPDGNGDSVDQYRVLIEYPTGGNVVDVNSGDRTHTTGALRRATNYTVRVQAHNSAGWGDWSPLRSFTTDATRPDKMNTPTVSSISSSSAVVNWTMTAEENGGNNINKYQVLIEYPSGSDFGLFDASSGARSFTVSGLARDTEYRARVRAVNDIGESTWSEQRAFTTDPTRPDTPVTPTVSGITSSGARVSWVAPNNGGSAITRYQLALEYAESTDDLELPYDTASPYDFTGLLKARGYTVQVRAENAVGWSSWSPRREFTTASTSASPPNLTSLSDIGPVSMKMSWLAPSDNGGEPITGYEIETSRDNFVTTEDTISTGVVGSYVVPDLIPGTTYWFRVRAVNSVGPGQWSNVLSADTLSGAKVRISGQWVDSIARVRQNGAWVQVLVKKRDSGTWKN